MLNEDNESWNSGQLRQDPSPGRFSFHVRCVFTTGHSLAMML
jgi:hypothetical protein